MRISFVLLFLLFYSSCLATKEPPLGEILLLPSEKSTEKTKISEFFFDKERSDSFTEMQKEHPFVEKEKVQETPFLIETTKDDAGTQEIQFPEKNRESIPEPSPSLPFHSVGIPIIDATLKKRLQSLYNLAKTQKSNLLSFSKIGDSHTVSNQFLAPFVGKYAVYDQYTYLKPLVDAFSKHNDSKGISSFDRTSLCATVGWSTDAPIKGSPSPLQKETTEWKPAFAFVLYGSNDMYKYASKVQSFENNMATLLQELIKTGVIPILSTIPDLGASRSDKHSLVPIYNASVTKLALQLQLPLIDLNKALLPLQDKGLRQDDIHLNAYKGWLGGDLSKEGLKYGNNVRNKLVLDTLYKIWRIVILDEKSE